MHGGDEKDYTKLAVVYHENRAARLTSLEASPKLNSLSDNTKEQ